CGPGALWAPGPQNAAAPPAQPRRPSPTPRQRGPGGPTAVARRRRKDGAVTGGGGVWQARGGPVGRPGAAKQKSGPRGLWPRAPPFQGAARPAAAPPRRWVLRPCPAGAGAMESPAARGLGMELALHALEGVVHAFAGAAQVIGDLLIGHTGKEQVGYLL